MATLPPPARPLVAPKVPPPKPRGTAARGFGATSRTSRWWAAPALQGTVFTVCATYLFISGVLLTPLFNTPYEVDGYLSPLFSPLIVLPFLPAWFSPAIAWARRCSKRSASKRGSLTASRSNSKASSRLAESRRSDPLT